MTICKSMVAAMKNVQIFMPVYNLYYKLDVSKGNEHQYHFEQQHVHHPHQKAPWIWVWHTSKEASSNGRTSYRPDDLKNKTAENYKALGDEKKVCQHIDANLEYRVIESQKDGHLDRPAKRVGDDPDKRRFCSTFARFEDGCIAEKAA